VGAFWNIEWSQVVWAFPKKTEFWGGRGGGISHPIS